ncbi:MAG: hypothetical protein HAW62_00580 [Endozoicomonadaceae bacterium]|nr:hypothetical protein [Endozoicomonadaceae bacterium]
MMKFHENKQQKMMKHLLNRVQLARDLTVRSTAQEKKHYFLFPSSVFLSIVSVLCVMAWTLL